MLIFKACLDLQFEKSIFESPLSINRPGETKLTLMPEIYDGPHQSDILRLVGPFMRQLKRRHEVVLSSHFISFARGSDVSKLRVCHRCGDTFSMDEFDLPDLKSKLKPAIATIRRNRKLIRNFFGQTGLKISEFKP